jgi:hypothetical protein
MVADYYGKGSKGKQEATKSVPASTFMPDLLIFPPHYRSGIPIVRENRAES